MAGEVVNRQTTCDRALNSVRQHLVVTTMMVMVMMVMMIIIIIVTSVRKEVME